jgi:dephospho-CoA kinase
MLRVGLTGGIASGKSTVAARMRERGLTVLDADQLAHQLMEPGQPAYDDVVREFGREVLAADGRIDRKKLGDIVFRDAAKRERLNAIVHPRVIEAREEQLRQMEAENPNGIAIMEAALLVESGYYKKLDSLIVCVCSPQDQIKRLRARGLSEEEARRRIEAQMPLEEKLRLAGEVFERSPDLEVLVQHKDLLFKFLNDVAGLSEEEAKLHIAAIAPIAEKTHLSDVCDHIDCSGTIEETLRQTDALVERLRKLAAQQSGKMETGR